MSIIPPASDIVAGAAGGLATDGAKGGLRRAADRAAELVHPGDLDNREATLAGPPAQELYTGFDARLRQLAILDEKQAAVVALLLREQHDAFQRLIDAIRATDPKTRAEVFHFQGTDRPIRVETPGMPAPGVWTIDSVAAWAAADNVGPVSLSFAIEGLLPIPFELVAPNNGVISVSLGLPLPDNAEIIVGPMAGGLVADRATVLVKFKLNS